MQRPAPALHVPREVPGLRGRHQHLEDLRGPGWPRRGNQAIRWDVPVALLGAEEHRGRSGNLARAELSLLILQLKLANVFRFCDRNVKDTFIFAA